MTTTRDFLVELGTEELPPTQLKKLSDAFTQGIVAGLKEAGLNDGIEVISYAAPRRLAVMVKNLAEKQQDRDEVIYGPPANIAFDADGKPTKAALGFAKKSGASVEDLSEENGKLKISRRIAGQATTELLAGIIQT
ncbi:MAG: glycyl-tRNA synthetase beta chain, partial [Oleispira sp.]